MPSMMCKKFNPLQIFIASSGEKWSSWHSSFQTWLPWCILVWSISEGPWTPCRHCRRRWPTIHRPISCSWCLATPHLTTGMFSFILKGGRLLYFKLDTYFEMLFSYKNYFLSTEVSGQALMNIFGTVEAEHMLIYYFLENLNTLIRICWKLLK